MSQIPSIGKHATLRTPIHLLMLAGWLVSSSLALAQAPQLTLQTPTNGQAVGDVFAVKAQTTGTFEVTSVTASVSTVSAPLSRTATNCPPSGSCVSTWEGNVDITTLPRGTQTLSVTAQDAASGTATQSVGIVHDNLPVVHVTAPLAEAVARPKLRVDATCTDDDAAGCASLTATVGAQTLLSGTASLHADLDLTAYDGQSINLNIKGTDSAGQQSIVTIPIEVESSRHLLKVAEVPGQVWDADRSRILWWNLGTRVYLRDRANGSDTLILTADPPPTSGFLTDAGAALGSNWSWENGNLVNLVTTNGGVNGKGRFIAWDLTRRDVVSGTTLSLSTNSSAREAYVARNGAATYVVVGFYEIWFYLTDGTNTRISPATSFWREGPMTDGFDVVYSRRATGAPAYIDSSVILNHNGTEQVLSTLPSYDGLHSPTAPLLKAYQIANGWVAFLKPSSAGVRDAWRMAPSGAQQRISFYNAHSVLDLLGEDGALFLNSANREYFSRPGTVLPLDIGSALGQPIFIGTSPHVALGNSLFRVQTTPARTDANGDGRGDITWRNATTGQVYRLLMNGLAIVDAAMVFTETNTAWRVVGDGDFNGDGIADLLWRNATSGEVAPQFFDASGSPTSAPAMYTEPNPAWKIVHTPDLDGDGHSDLLWWNSSTGQVYAVLMNGSAIAAQGMVYTEADTAWRIVATGDFAGTGRQNQLLWRNSTSGAVYLMTVTFTGGAFQQTGTIIYNEPNTAWKIVAAADFNGDGNSDILWRNDATGQVYMMLMNGATITNQGIVYQETDPAWKIVAQSDYNGDGKVDLLWRNDSNGQVYLMLMDGLTITSAGMIYQEPNADWQILGPREYETRQ